MTSRDKILVSRCTSCHGRFLSREGPCPRCGSNSVTPHPLPAIGVVLAAVELTAPAAPWPSPHRLALVELEESVRVLALCPGGLPSQGDRVRVERDGDRYMVTALAPT
ncbi:MAG: hypothetical protein L3J73_02675 [Thermoplasmata archaeon]|nr:hypothetical protein [Thermoplasmata archaeon]